VGLRVRRTCWLKLPVEHATLNRVERGNEKDYFKRDGLSD
jgi:hypothetical protein